MTRLIFADAETVSVVPGPATIWELALIWHDADSSYGNGEYLWHIRPDLTGADPAALRVGGYYSRSVAQRYALGHAVSIPIPGDDGDGEKSHLGSEQLAGSVARMLDGATLVAANPAFEAGHLAAFLKANGECLTADYHYVDIGSLVRGFVAPLVTPPCPLKVTDAAELVGIDPGKYETHTALGDARLVRDIWRQVMSGGGAG